MQISVAAFDQALAAGVVYVLLPPDTHITFHVFLGIYVIAAPISPLSLVPGGLGVFETVVVTLLVGPSKAVLLGSLIAYRLIYFILPFASAILLVTIYEMRRSSHEFRLAWATARRPDQEWQTRSRPSSAMKIPSLPVDSD